MHGIRPTSHATKTYEIKHIGRTSTYLREKVQQHLITFIKQCNLGTTTLWCHCSFVSIYHKLT
jgi:hypothetical protein